MLRILQLHVVLLPKLCCCCLFFLKTIDECNKLQFLKDDNELLQAADLLYKKFPKFSFHFDEYFGDFSSTSAQGTYDTESNKM